MNVKAPITITDNSKANFVSIRADRIMPDKTATQKLIQVELKNTDVMNGIRGSQPPIQF